jgi:ribosomal protein S18 acetylase RimI-like enzyme
VQGSRGRGLGSALVDETMRMAEKMGVSKVVLTCLKRKFPGLLRGVKVEVEVEVEVEVRTLCLLTNSA